MSNMSKKKSGSVVLAIVFTVTAIVLGYVALGIIPAFIFTFGYLGGLIIWLLKTTNANFRQIRGPYFITMLLFIVHKIEERKMDFFPALSELTGVPVPDATSAPAILLYSIAAVWLFIPLLIWRQYAFGYYLAWTFFASMGITELAHFVFPFFKDGPYGYFPGMASVLLLAPAAWWGMYKLSQTSKL
jgi:hypothetical protein